MKEGEQLTMAECAITTVDNPFDPFDQFDDWFMYDTDKGYNSCSYLARIARTSDSLTDEENEAEIERAIDEIVFFNPEIYRKVRRNNHEDRGA